MTPHELKAWRERHGFTQSQAAEELGIPISAVENYEAGERRGQGKFSVIPEAIEQTCNSFDRKHALRLKIKDKLQSSGPPGHITPEILQEILLEIVDAI